MMTRFIRVWIGYGFTFVHKGLLVIMQHWTWDSEQGF